jgi:predicted nucleic acid-binding protein
MKKVYIDASGWFALANSAHPHHESAKEYFQQLLDTRVRLYSNVMEINQVISDIKKKCSLNLAVEFSKLIDESVLSTNLHVSWLTRRLQRNSLKHFLTFKDVEINIKHCIIFEEVKKKRISFLFSFDDVLKKFGIPLMPQA